MKRKYEPNTPKINKLLDTVCGPEHFGETSPELAKSVAIDDIMTLQHINTYINTMIVCHTDLVASQHFHQQISFLD